MCPLISIPISSKSVRILDEALYLKSKNVQNEKISYAYIHDADPNELYVGLFHSLAMQ